MVSELEGHLGRQGLGMIAPDEGAHRLADELSHGGDEDIEVIVAGDLGPFVEPIERDASQRSPARERIGPAVSS
jgi:hypothetical protein